MQPQATKEPPTTTAPDPTPPAPAPGPTPPPSGGPTPPVASPAGAAKKSMNTKWLVVGGVIVVVALIVWFMTK